jgi:hypothetical protein
MGGRRRTKSGDAIQGTTLIIIIAGGKQKLYCPVGSRQCHFVLLIKVGSNATKINLN